MLIVKKVEIQAVIPKNEHHKNVRVNFTVDKLGVSHQFKDIGCNLSSEEAAAVREFEVSLIDEPLFKRFGIDIRSNLGWNSLGRGV